MILPTALILALAQPALSLATDRATWLWDATMMQDSAQVADFLAFAEAKGVTKVYAGVNADVPNEAFGSFIEGCSARGIAVGALIGNSQWILDRGTPSLEDNLSWIEQYQGSSVVASDGGKRFAEVHMDIEPWVLEDWDTPATQAQYVASWQEKILTIATFTKNLDNNVSIAADLPFWANTIQSANATFPTMDAWMLGIVDSATFMTYRSDPALLLDIAAPALEAGDAAADKQVWLAVETTDVGDAALSYYGRSKSELAEDLVTIQEGAETHASFAGIAVHDSVGWAALQ